MERSIDSDYLDLSYMGGFDMGFDFDSFEENVKKFIELPIKYLDSAHDKAVEFIEDVHAIFSAPFTDDEVPNNEDQSSSNVVIESSPAYVETELVGPNTEASTPASSITMENSSSGCVDTDAHGTESVSTKSTDSSLMNDVCTEKTSSEGGHIEANDLSLLPEAEDSSLTGVYDSSEEVILWNPETSAKPPRPREIATIPQDGHVNHALETYKGTGQVVLHCSRHSDSSICSGAIPLENCSANYGEEVVLHSANDPDGITIHDFTTIAQDDYVPQALDNEKQARLHCSGHSDILVDSAVFFEALLQEDSTSNYEEQMVSYSANIPVEATTHAQDVSPTLNREQQTGLHSSGHSDILVDSAVFFEGLLLENSTSNCEEQMVSCSANGPVEATTHESSAGTSISHELSLDFPGLADDPNMPTHNMVKFEDIDLRNDQEHMKNDKIEVFTVPQYKNASFKKMFLRSLSSKLRWSKKQANLHQAMPDGPEDAENLGYQLVSSLDDLGGDWEVL